MKRRLRGPFVALVISLVILPGVAWASWSSMGSGSGYTAAYAMPSGATPNANVTNRNVAVSWSASQLPNGSNVSGYNVKRYDTSNVAQPIGSGCSGLILVLTCTAIGVTPGTWTYTVTPRQAGWVGGEGAKSVAVTVNPPSLSFSSSTTISVLPTTMTGGTLTNFLEGETLVFRLDNPTTGQVLVNTLTPDPIPANGQAAATVTIPIGTTAAAHTVYAVGSLGSQASIGITVLPNDSVPPTVSSSLIGKTGGGVGGFVKQNGTYYVYANVTDTGSPATGVASVTANVTNVTTGTTAAPLGTAGGPFTVQGVSYNYRSASLTASNPLGAGSESYTITAIDVGGNSGTQGGFSVMVDNTAPTGTNIQTTNGGATVGRAETGDTITFTFSETMDPYTILAGWDGTATPVTLRLVQQGMADRIQIWDSANTTQLPFGDAANSISLAQNDYTTATVNFTSSSMVMSGSTITVTLGTPSGAVTTAAANGTMTWTPSNTPWDYAANALSHTTVTETGGADREF